MMNGISPARGNTDLPVEILNTATNYNLQMLQNQKNTALQLRSNTSLVNSANQTVRKMENTGLSSKLLRHEASGMRFYRVGGGKSKSKLQIQSPPPQNATSDSYEDRQYNHTQSPPEI